jgi:hypothetical protein
MAKLFAKVPHHGAMDEETTNSKTSSLPNQFQPSQLLALNSLQTNDKEVQPPLALIINKIEPVLRNMQHVGLGLKSKGKQKQKFFSSASVPSFAGKDSNLQQLALQVCNV